MTASATANSQVEKLFGYRQGELRGQSVELPSGMGAKPVPGRRLFAIQGLTRGF